MPGIPYGPPRVPVANTGANLMVGTLPETLAKVVIPPRPGVEPTYEKPSPTPHERRRFGVVLIPAAAVKVFEEYVGLMGERKLTIRHATWGAAWAIFTAKISAPAWGYVVKAIRTGGYNFDLATPEQTAYHPGTLPDDVVIGAPGQVPVIYPTVVALVTKVVGADYVSSYLSNFDTLMTSLTWTPCARVPRAYLSVWCPTRVPRAGPQHTLIPGLPNELLAPVGKSS